MSPQTQTQTLLSQNVTTGKRRRTPDSSPEVLEAPATRPRLDTATPRPKHHGISSRIRIISNITLERAAAPTQEVPAAFQQQTPAAHEIKGPEQIKTWLQDFLLEPAALGPDSHTKDLVLLAKAALTEPIHVLKPIIKEWIGLGKTSIRSKTRKVSNLVALTPMCNRAKSREETGTTPRPSRAVTVFCRPLTRFFFSRVHLPYIYIHVWRSVGNNSDDIATSANYSFRHEKLSASLSEASRTKNMTRPLPTSGSTN